MKKQVKCYLYLLACLVTHLVTGQQIEKFRLGLLPYYFDEKNVPEVLAVQANTHIIKALQKSSRFSYIERQEGQTVLSEIKSEGHRQGVNYLLSVDFLSYRSSYTFKTQGGGDSPARDFLDFRAVIDIVVKLYDVETSEVRAQEIILVTGSHEYDLGNKSVSEKWIEEGRQIVQKKVEVNVSTYLIRYLNTVFPAQIPVQEIVEQSEEGISRVKAAHGKDLGLTPESNCYIYTLKPYNQDGRTLIRVITLANGFVTKNTTAETAEIKLWMGRKVLKKAYEEKQPLFVSTHTQGLNYNSVQEKSIAILPFVKKGDMLPEDKAMLERLVLNSVMVHGRFRVIERGNLHILDQEREQQKSDSFLQSEVIQQGKNIGADYLLMGEGYECQTFVHKAMESLDAPSGIYTRLRFRAQVLNVATGQVEAFQEFIVDQTYRNAVTAKPSATPALSLQWALFDLHVKINRWLVQTFPLNLQIIEVTDSSKQEAKQVIINGGTGTGLHLPVSFSTVNALAGTPLEVFEIHQEDVDGKQMERTVLIGEIVLKKIESDLISVCKVRKGGEAIYKNMQQGKAMTVRIKRKLIE